MEIIRLIGLVFSNNMKKYTNKNIRIGVKKDLFNTDFTQASFRKDYSRLVDVYYNDVRIGIMEDTFKFEKSIPKEDRDKLKPMVKEYLKHCYLVKKQREIERKKEISDKLWK